VKNIADNLAGLRQQMVTLAAAYQRDPETINLLAVSKRQPVEAIRAMRDAGQVDFGENYLQEALDKIATLGSEGLCWHFIGPLQSNKTRTVAEHFDWVHTLERAKTARRLNDQRPAARPPLNVCIQVNISDEPSKSGISLVELPELAAAVAELPRLRLRGLMTLPAPADDLASQRRPFAELRSALEDLRTQGLELDTLSMGTSGDLEAAIAEGATIVRIGTALFGPRSG